MSTPPPLNGQILSPSDVHPMGAAPMSAVAPQIIYVTVPGNNLARAGSELVRALMFTSGATAVGLVLATAIFPQALKPAYLMGHFSAVQHNTFVEETTRTDADRQRYIELNHNKVAADTSCAVGKAAGSALAHNGGQEFAPLANFFAELACQTSRNLGEAQRQDY